MKECNNGSLENYIHTALGTHECDMVLKNATFVNVFNCSLEKGDIAITDDRIVGIGDYSGKTEIDVSGKIVVPGYIDGHVHIESSQLSPEGFAALILPHGTTTVIADPHEITNVCGMSGVEYIINASKNVPLDVKVQLPSCVPATPFETSGAILNGEEIEKHIDNDNILGLGEFMNYPGLLSADSDVLRKLQAAHEANKIIDGHAPFLTGKQLNAYLCGGISTDHECTTIDEVQEKVSKGMYVHLRVGSYTRSMELVHAITRDNMRRFIMCTDDRHAADLKKNGHIDNAMRRCVKEGLDPILAVVIGTLNCAECYGLKYRGAIAPYYYADLVVIDDMESFNAEYVIKDGKIVAHEGKPLFDVGKRYLNASVLNTVHLNELTPDDFKIQLKGDKANVMTTSFDGVMTGKEVMTIPSKNGDVDILGTNILKMFVVERHRLTGNIGKGLIKDYGFKGGAMGISISHDSHNIILIGDDNESLCKAATTLRDIGGGMVIADSQDGKVYSLPLDIAGLMSSGDADTLEEGSRLLIERAYSMGVDKNKEAFFSLAFLSLAVIPEIRLLDTGLFDVNRFDFIPLDAE